MQRESPSISAFKIWIFPSLVSIVSLLIWNDVNEIKADVKALMAQSNIDKTRIDNLERQVFKTASIPGKSEDQTFTYMQTYAVLPKDETDYKHKKTPYDF